MPEGSSLCNIKGTKLFGARNWKRFPFSGKQAKDINIQKMTVL